jgi:hypothetical protein
VLPARFARSRPSAVRVRIRSRSTSARPPRTAIIKRPVLVPVSGFTSGHIFLRGHFRAVQPPQGLRAGRFAVRAAAM